MLVRMLITINVVSVV
jgi:hypothetical protein